MTVIDSHTHCFPDALAPRALSKLESNEALTPRCDGTRDGLLAVLDRDGVDQCFVLNIATNAHQQDKVNEFATQINRYQKSDLFIRFDPSRLSGYPRGGKTNQGGRSIRRQAASGFYGI